MTESCDKSSTSFKIVLKRYEENGTLDLLRMACKHPMLVTILSKLTDNYITIYNDLVSEFDTLSDLFETKEKSEISLKLYNLEHKCRCVIADMNDEILKLDCLDLDNLQKSWGTRSSVRQSRREFIQLCEGFCEELTKGLEFVTDKIEKEGYKYIPPEPVKPSPPKKPCSNTDEFQSNTPSKIVKQELPKAPGKRWDVTPNPVGLVACAPAIHSIQKEYSSDSENEYSKDQKRRRRKKINIDWKMKTAEKIQAFKDHTLKGGCVTTLFETPVNRETLLSLLSKCETYLSEKTFDVTQLKVAIETFIAGLEMAYNNLSQLRINKAQMKLLYETASVLDNLDDYQSLLPQLRSLQGLLKTFGMF